MEVHLNYYLLDPFENKLNTNETCLAKDQRGTDASLLVFTT